MTDEIDDLETLFSEGLRITTVRSAHSKYMKMKKAQGVAKDKPGPSKGKAGGKGPKYMPKGRVVEGLLSEFAKSDKPGGPEDYERGRHKRMYKAGPVIDPGGDNHKDMNTYTYNHNKHTGPYAKFNVKTGAHKGTYVVSHLSDRPHPKTGERYRIMHLMTNDKETARKAYDALDKTSDGALLHPPGTLKYKPHQISQIAPLHEETEMADDDVTEGFLSKKLKSIKKYVTGQREVQQDRLATKIKSQMDVQPAKLAAADDYVGQLSARFRGMDLKNRLKAVTDPVRKREETEGMFGPLGGQYLSGKVSTANNFRGAAMATAKFRRSVGSLAKNMPKLDAAIGTLQKVIEKKRAAQQAATGAAVGAAMGNPALGAALSQPKPKPKKGPVKAKPDLVKRHNDAKAKSAKKSKPY